MAVVSSHMGLCEGGDYRRMQARCHSLSGERCSCFPGIISGNMGNADAGKLHTHSGEKLQTLLPSALLASEGTGRTLKIYCHCLLSALTVNILWVLI